MATYRTSAAGGGTSGSSNRTVTITPAVGDLLLVFCHVTTNTNAAPTCTDNNGSGTYTLITTALRDASTDILSCFVRTAKMVNTTSTVITVATGTNDAGAVVAVAVSGMSQVGAAAIRQSKAQANGAAAGTPAPAFDTAAKNENLTLGAVANAGTAGSIIVPPTNWTERQDVAQTTPATGLEVATRDLGFTGTTITWGGTSATAFSAIIVELDCGHTPPVGAVTLTGDAPVIGLGLGIVPPTGTITATGAAPEQPTEPAETQITPPVGALTGTGAAPDVSQTLILTPNGPLAIDLFNRTDSTDLGAEWSVWAGGTGHQIVGNRVRVGAVDEDYKEEHVAVLPPNQYAQITIPTITNNFAFMAGVGVRTDGAALNGIFLSLNGGQVRVSFINAGSTINSGAVLGGVAGDTLRLEVVGTALRGYRNGVKLFEQRLDASADFPTGKASIRLYAESVIGGVEVDDFSAGPLAELALTGAAPVILENITPWRGTRLATDTFNRANNADLGATWEPWGGGHSPLAIVNQRVRASTSLGALCIEEHTAVLGLNQWAQATIVTDTASGSLMGPVIRSTETGTIGYRLVTVGSELRLMRYSTGTSDVIGSVSVDHTDHTDAVLRVEAEGSAVRGYYNGALLIDVVDGSPLPVGRAGLMIQTISSVTEVELDDFSCGNLDVLFTGAAPTVVLGGAGENTSITPPVGALAFTGRTPLIRGPVVLTSNGDIADLTSYASASITPTADRLILVFVRTRMAVGAGPNIPSVSGCGITWASAASVLYASSTSDFRLSVFSGSSASPSTGTLTFSFAGQTQLDCHWTVVEVTAAVNPASIVQAVTNGITNTSVTIIPVNYGSVMQATNFALATVHNSRTTGDIIPRTGWIELADAIFSTTMETQWLSIPDTIASGSASVGVPAWGIIGLELGAFGTPQPSPATLTLTGAAPTVSIPILLTPPAGALTLTGATPIVAHNAVVPPAGTISFTHVRISLALVGAPPTVSVSTAGADISITPQVGALALTGLAPTISVPGDTAITPQGGALVLTGIAPTVSVSAHAAITPQTGTLTLTGALSTVLSGALAIPPSAALVLTGQVPSVRIAVALTPPAGTLTLTGVAPTPLVAVSLTPPAGTLVLSGAIPSLRADHRLTPLVGAVVLQGAAPGVRSDTRITPQVGALVLAGQPPTVRTAAFLTPAAGTLTFQGIAPTPRTVSFATPATALLTLTGAAPSLRQNAVITPASGALAITGQAPSALQSAVRAPGTGTLTFQGAAGRLAFEIFTSTGSLTLTGAAPTVFAGLTGSIDLVGYAPTLDLGIRTASGALTLTGHAPAAFASRAITPATGTLTLTGYAPAQGQGITPASAALVLTGQVPAVVQNEVIRPQVGTLTLTGVPGRLDLTLTPAAGTATLTGAPPALLALATITPATESLTLTGASPLLALAIRPAGTALTLTGYAPAPLALGVSVPTGTLTLQGAAPRLNLTITPATGVLTLSGAAPTSTLALTPQTGALTFTGWSSDTTAPVTITPAVGTLVLTGEVPGAASGLLSPDTGVLTFTGHAPTVLLQIQIPGGAGSSGTSGESVGDPHTSGETAVDGSARQETIRSSRIGAESVGQASIVSEGVRAPRGVP